MYRKKECFGIKAGPQNELAHCRERPKGEVVTTVAHSGGQGRHGDTNRRTENVELPELGK